MLCVWFPKIYSFLMDINTNSIYRTNVQYILTLWYKNTKSNWNNGNIRRNRDKYLVIRVVRCCFAIFFQCAKMYEKEEYRGVKQDFSLLSIAVYGWEKEKK